MKQVEYFVEYIDNLTLEKNSEIWTEELLNKELTRNEVTVIHIELAYHLLKELGMAED